MNTILMKLNKNRYLYFPMNINNDIKNCISLRYNKCNFETICKEKFISYIGSVYPYHLEHNEKIYKRIKKLLELSVIDRLNKDNVNISEKKITEGHHRHCPEAATACKLK